MKTFEMLNRVSWDVCGDSYIFSVLRRVVVLFSPFHCVLKLKLETNKGKESPVRTCIFLNTNKQVFRNITPCHASFFQTAIRNRLLIRSLYISYLMNERPGNFACSIQPPSTARVQMAPTCRGTIQFVTSPCHFPLAFPPLIPALSSLVIVQCRWLLPPAETHNHSVVNSTSLHLM